MPDLNQGDLLEGRLFCTAGDQTSVNVIHYEVISIQGGTVSQEAATDDLATHFANSYKGALCAAATYNGAGLRRITPLIPTSETFSPNGAGPGNLIGTLMPRQVCGLITKRTATPGPRGRGRFYVAFPPEEANEGNGVPTVPYVGLITALANALDDDVIAVDEVGLGTATLRLQLVNRLTFQHLEVTRCDPRAKWATQRRRGSYGRPNVSPV